MNMLQTTTQHTYNNTMATVATHIPAWQCSPKRKIKHKIQRHIIHTTNSPVTTKKRCWATGQLDCQNTKTTTQHKHKHTFHHVMFYKKEKTQHKHTFQHVMFSKKEKQNTQNTTTYYTPQQIPLSQKKRGVGNWSTWLPSTKQTTIVTHTLACQCSPKKRKIKYKRQQHIIPPITTKKRHWQLANQTAKHTTRHAHNTTHTSNNATLTHMSMLYKNQTPNNNTTHTSNSAILTHTPACQCPIKTKRQITTQHTQAATQHWPTHQHVNAL